MKRTLIYGVIVAWVMAATIVNAQETNANTNASVKLDFDSFGLVYKRNIFDPNRTSGTRPVVRRQPVRVDRFTLVGTMSYEKGSLAFFDGSSSEYRKTLKPMQTIAGYKVAQIAPDYILLAASSNQTIKLPVGTQMRRSDGGRWTVGGRNEPTADSSTAATAESPADSSTGSSSSPANAAAVPSVSGGAESEALKRLMAKRLNEK